MRCKSGSTEMILRYQDLKMVESGDDYTKIGFVNKKLNIDIPLEKFSFK